MKVLITVIHSNLLESKGILVETGHSEPDSSSFEFLLSTDQLRSQGGAEEIVGE